MVNNHSRHREIFFSALARGAQPPAPLKSREPRQLSKHATNKNASAPPDSYDGTPRDSELRVSARCLRQPQGNDGSRENVNSSAALGQSRDCRSSP